MKILDNVMSNMLCCIGYHNSDDAPPSSSLRTTAANKDTPISVSVHGPSVPHAIDSPDALHKIFASNSSMRGYNAVQTRPMKRTPPNGSLDLNFRFGSESPQKPKGRLEQLTHHVKQKLSEGKMSLNGERRDDSTAAPIQLSTTHRTTIPDATTKLLGQSQKSLGLTELLASRAGSEGGYDSDARSIQTPTVLSTTDTVKNGSRNIYRSLGIIEASESDEKPTESSEMVTNSIIDPNASGMSRASHASLTTPLDILRDVSNELPVDVSHQVKPGGSRRNGESSDPSKSYADQEITVATIHHLPSLLNSKTRLHATNSSSEMHDRSKDHGSDIGSTKAENDAFIGVSNSCLETHPTSFAMPAAPSPCEVSSTTSPPMTVVKAGSKSVGDGENKSDAVLDSKKDLIMKQDSSATTSSDAKSVHLFNMRISQRLASGSRIPILSSTGNSNTNPSKPLLSSSSTIDVQSAKSSLSRGPTFIAIESNRRPSDPQTKTLFEPSKPSFRQPNWRRSLSDGSVKVLDPLEKDRSLSVDDSSSFYGSVASGGTDHREISPLPSTRAVLRNKNSLAVAGRSASASIPTKHTINGQSKSQHAGDSIVQPNESCDTSQTVEESFYTPEEIVKGRSVSMPKPSKYIRVDTTPTPMMRKFRFSTEANEDMSEIGIERINGGRHDIKSSETTQAIKDRINEDFSESSITGLEATRHDEAGMRDAWLSQGRRTGWGFDFANSPSRRRLSASYGTGEHSIIKESRIPDDQDDTTQIWRKAFRRLGESADHGKLLATPQFDREGRRKPSNASVSDQGQQTGDYPRTPASHRRSQSVDLKRNDIWKETEIQRNRRKSLPLLTARGSKITKRKSFPKDKTSKLKKKSSEIHQRLTSGVTESSPSKDILGIWGRFASHTRDLRNGPAGTIDLVKVRDFELDVEHEADRSLSTQATGLSSSPTLQLRKSLNRLTMKNPISRRTTKSMSFALSSAEKAKLRRRGFFGRVRHLYRTRSSELQAYTSIQGHRSSVAPGLVTEYPELEIVGTNTTPESNHHQFGPEVDGASEKWRKMSLESISEIASRKSRSIHSHTLPWSKKDAEEWSKLYQDCVGSLSALRNSEDGNGDTLAIPAVNERRILSLTSVLRDSTVNFEAELKKTTDQEKEKLLRQLQSSDERESDPVMPGSFA